MKSFLLKILLNPILISTFATMSMAQNINSFDVSGIKIGSNLKEAKRISGCSPSKEKNEFGSLVRMHLACEKEDVSWQIMLNNDGEVYHIIKTFSFPARPDLSPINKRIVSKYGRPDMDGKSSPISSNSAYSTSDFLITQCWGMCNRVNTGDRWRGSRVEGIGNLAFQVAIRSLASDHLLDLTLSSSSMINGFRKYEKALEREDKKKAAKKLDF